MNRIIHIKNPLEMDRREIHEVESHVQWLKDQWPQLPKNVSLFHDEMLPENNVTPVDEDSIRRFMKLRGDLYVLEMPLTGVEIAYAVLAVALVAAVLLIKTPVPPGLSNRNQSPPSANNDLSQRTNKARPNARIPDIYGSDISVPDLIATTYSVYNEHHQEVEYSYMCIGRGEFECSELKDDTTTIEQIENASVEVYGPNTSPNYGTPQLRIGQPINEPVLSVVRTEAVNGQQLPAPNEDALVGQFKLLYPNKVIVAADAGVDFTLDFDIGDALRIYGSVMRFGSYDNIYPNNVTSLDFTSAGAVSGLGFTAFGGESTAPYSGAGLFFRLIMSDQVVGSDTINLSGYYNVITDDMSGNLTLRDVNNESISWALLPGGATTLNCIVEPALLYLTTYDMGGVYDISAVSATELELTLPGLVNPYWSLMYDGGGTVPDYPPGSSANLTLALNDAGPGWVGPFDVPLEGQTNFILNFVAKGGLYKDDGTVQTATNVSLEIEYTPLSITGAAIGASKLYRITLQGSAFTQTERTKTLRANMDLPPTALARFRVRRTTLRDTGFTGQVSDDVQWKDLYVTAPVAQPHFGNVTTVQAVMYATKGALSLKQRKFNLRVVKKLYPLLASDTAPFYEFGPTKEPTMDMADILADICLDPTIGAALETQVALASLRTTSDAIKTYFGREACRRFSYTFDDDNTSFEEIVNAVASACFCTALRRGNVIDLFLEKENLNSSLLFNHRNKIPGTEERDTSFGLMGNYDGIEFEYKNPNDSAPEIIRLPADGSAIKPQTIKSIGVKSKTQATLLAYRAWNKIQYQRETVEFTGLQEAALTQKNMRVLVANNVKPFAQDGEVRSKDGLVIETSQPVDFEDATDYVIFLQATDGTVQSVSVSAGSDKYHVVLESEPVAALSLDPLNYTVAGYIIAKDTDSDKGALAYLIQERDYDGPTTSKLSCINYDKRYYQNDKDFNLRIAHYTGYVVDYDDATTDQKADGGFYADGTADPVSIPTANDPPYVYGGGIYEE